MKKRTIVYIGIVFLSLVWLVSSVNVAEGKDTSVYFSKIKEGNLKLNRVIITVNPTGTIEGNLLRDALSTKLSSSGISVVSWALTDRIQQKLFKKIAMTDEKSNENKEKEIIDPLRVAEETGADAILAVTAFFDNVHTNIYDPETIRVNEVRRVLKINVASYSLIDVKSGELIGGAAVEYDTPMSVLKVVEELSKRIIVGIK